MTVALTLVRVNDGNHIDYGYFLDENEERGKFFLGLPPLANHDQLIEMFAI